MTRHTYKLLDERTAKPPQYPVAPIRTVQVNDVEAVLPVQHRAHAAKLRHDACLNGADIARVDDFRPQFSQQAPQSAVMAKVLARLLAEIVQGHIAAGQPFAKIRIAVEANDLGPVQRPPPSRERLSTCGSLACSRRGDDRLVAHGRYRV